MAYMRLGDLLIASGVITQEQLDKALAVQKETHQRLGDVLMQNGFITERNLIDALPNFPCILACVIHKIFF